MGKGLAWLPSKVDVHPMQGNVTGRDSMGTAGLKIQGCSSQHSMRAYLLTEWTCL